MRKVMLIFTSIAVVPSSGGANAHSSPQQQVSVPSEEQRRLTAAVERAVGLR